MVNYYAELGLDRSLSIEELEKELKSLKRKWTTRASSASSTDKRQEAERMVALVREASTTLLNKDSKAKYDKDLDKAPASNVPTAAPTQDPTAFYNAGAAMVDLVEQFYDSGNYNQALAVANKAFEGGVATVEIYRIASLCYIERGDNGAAYRTLVNMRNAFPGDYDADLVYAIFCIRLLPDHAADGHKVVSSLIESGLTDNGLVCGLDAEYSLLCGDVELAEQKIQAYLNSHSHDNSYREQICNAYARYADTFLTSYGGDMYFNSQEDCDSWFKYTQRALEIYNDPDLRKQFNDNKSIVGGRQFLTDNWLGILCSVFYAFAGFSTNILLGIVLAAVAVAEIYYSIVPKWMVHRYNYTNKLVGIYEVFRIINWILSLLFRIGWEITKFIFRLIFAFI
jgi:curved DNA-binding protein CbpA